MDYYTLYFKITSGMGIQPFVLDEAELKVTPVKKGFTWYHFTHNAVRQGINLMIECLLLFRNYWTHLKYDTMGGKGYLIQLAWASGLIMGFTPMVSNLRNLDQKAKLFADWIRLERKLDGMSYTLHLCIVWQYLTKNCFSRNAAWSTSFQGKASALSKAPI